MLDNTRHYASTSFKFQNNLKCKHYHLIHLIFISEETEAQSKRFDNLFEISGLIRDGIKIKNVCV